MLLRRPAWPKRRPAILAAVVCLALAGPGLGTAAAAPARALARHHHAGAPPLHRDTTPLPKDVLDAGTSTTASEPATASSSGAFVRMMAGLAIVLAVIYAVYWLLKTYGKAKRDSSADGRLTLLGTTTLAPNRALHLVRIGEEVILVGSAEQSVTAIRVYDANALRRAGVDVDGALADGGPSQAGVRPANARPAGLLDALRRMTAR